MRSASVDLPWSMCAMMQKFRISSGRVNVWSANEVTQFPSGAGTPIVPRPAGVTRPARNNPNGRLHRTLHVQRWTDGRLPSGSSPGFRAPDPATEQPSWGAMVHHSRAPVSAMAEAGCSLLRGEPACRCLRDVRHLTDEQILDRATDMFRWQQLAAPGGRAAARRGLDGLLADARSHRPSTLVTPLLGIGIAAARARRSARRRRRDRDAARRVPRAGRAAPTTACCWARRPRCGRTTSGLQHRREPRWPRGGGGAGRADRPASRRARTSDPPAGPRSLSRSLNGLVLVLLTLGAHEIADEVSQRAIAVSNMHRLGAGPADPPAQPGPAAAVLGAAAGARRPGGGRHRAAGRRRAGARGTRPGCGPPRSAGTGPTGRRPPRSARSSPPPTRCTGPDRAISTPLDRLRPHRALLRRPDPAGHRDRPLPAGRRPAGGRGGARWPRCATSSTHGSSEVALTLALHREFALADAAVQHAADPTGPRRRRRRPRTLRRRAGGRAVGAARGRDLRAAQPLREPPAQPRARRARPRARRGHRAAAGGPADRAAEPAGAGPAAGRGDQRGEPAVRRRAGRPGPLQGRQRRPLARGRRRRAAGDRRPPCAGRCGPRTWWPATAATSSW